MSHNGWSNAYNWKFRLYKILFHRSGHNIKVYQLAIDYAVKGVATIKATETASLVNYSGVKLKYLSVGILS